MESRSEYRSNIQSRSNFARAQRALSPNREFCFGFGIFGILYLFMPRFRNQIIKSVTGTLEFFNDKINCFCFSIFLGILRHVSFEIDVLKNVDKFH